MNYLKFFVCWWQRTHIYARFYRADGSCVRRCVRCGHEVQ